MINLENVNDSINKFNLDGISLFEDTGYNNNTDKSTSILKHAQICFKSKLFRFSTISLITLLLILSGIQFWINDFMENAIHILDKKERLFYSNNINNNDWSSYNFWNHNAKIRRI